MSNLSTGAEPWPLTRSHISFTGGRRPQTT
jgi:hypothetical protein